MEEISSSTSSAEDLKLLGNKWFAERKYEDAIRAYSEGSLKDANEPAFPSNTAACYFELGQYEKCIEQSKRAIDIIDRIASSDPKQIRKKNVIRIARSLYLCAVVGNKSRLTEYLSALPSLYDDDNDINAIRKRLVSIEEPTAETDRFLTHELPRISPARENNAIEYFAVGHDTATSALKGYWDESKPVEPTEKDGPLPRLGEDQSARLLFKQHPKLSFFFGGVSDGRHVIYTLADARRQLDDIKGRDDVKLHIVMNDLLPTCLARDILVLSILADLGEAESLESIYTTDNKDRYGKLAVLLYYIYCGVVMPSDSFDLLMTRIERLIEQGNTKTLPAWLAVVDDQQWSALAKVFRYWRKGNSWISPKEILEAHKLSTSMDVLDADTPEGVTNPITAMKDEKSRLMSQLCDPAFLAQMGLPEDKKADFMKMVNSGALDDMMMGGTATTLPLAEETGLLYASKVLLPPVIVDSDQYQQQLERIYHTACQKKYDYKDSIQSVTEGVANTWKTNITITDEFWRGIGCYTFDPISAVSNFYEMKWVGEPSQDKPRLFDYFINVFYQAAQGLVGLSKQNALLIEPISGDLHLVLDDIVINKNQRIAKGYASEFDTIYLSNVPDYTGYISIFSNIVLSLKREQHCSVAFNSLLNPGLFRSLDEVLNTYLLIPSKELLAKHIGVEHRFGDQWSTYQHYGYSQAATSLDNLLSRDELTAWLTKLFISIALPAPNPPMQACMVNAPNNISVFFCLVKRLVDIGYPRHWLQSIIEQIASGFVNSSSTSIHPKRVIAVTNTTETARRFSLCALQLEFTNQAALWLEHCGFRISSPVLPLASSIQRWTLPLTFTDHGRGNNESPSLMVVIEYPSISESQRMKKHNPFKPEMDEKYRYQIALLPTKEIAQILSVIEFSQEKSTVSFWLSLKDMDHLINKNCVLSVFRKDHWKAISAPIVLSYSKFLQIVIRPKK
ncbi:hypothetical protein PPL_07205 [Heterostelium album PN500]|uniref:DUF4470 domain-containing protein n=1 Tax=Heterostelium pallidum (strain ATCC 26659 / Pp 5 / PN500) TaxID=670386 RepID=D3BEP0_HETP5|nr:hypothetical protein PPL_07205 [Heterostelium album PN500]EFA80371.1 hypothetical protein PPL_07205 [Heterostelium album PN500]|eukprot:XP_020432491.1 hypothetical protein PPL_07205 [Heterostelium album PN500]